MFNLMRQKDNDDMYEKLHTRISELVSDTKYKLTFLKYDWSCFGNVIAELTSNGIVTRFVYDRGDIYYECKMPDTSQWLDMQVAFSHEEPKTETYELLFKAIEDFVKA